MAYAAACRRVPLVDRAAVEARVERVEEELEALDDTRSAGRRAYMADGVRQRAAERSLQVSIQACIDIGAHLVAAGGLGAPSDQADVFELLAQRAGLERSLAAKMKEAAGQRNLLVHAYLAIDPERVWLKLEELEDLRAFARWALARAGR